MKKLFFLAAIAALSVCCTNQLDVNSNEAIRNKVINHRNNQPYFIVTEVLDNHLFDSQELEDMTSNYFGDDGITHGSATIDYIYSSDFYPVFEQLLPIIDPYFVAPADQIEVPTIALAVVNYSNTGYAVYIPYKTDLNPLVLCSHEGNIDSNIFNLSLVESESNLLTMLSLNEIVEEHHSWVTTNSNTPNISKGILNDFYCLVSNEILRFIDFGIINWGEDYYALATIDTITLSYSRIPADYTLSQTILARAILDLIYNLHLVDNTNSANINTAGEELTLGDIAYYFSNHPFLFYLSDDGILNLNYLNSYLNDLGISLEQLQNINEAYNTLEDNKYVIRIGSCLNSCGLVYECIRKNDSYTTEYIFTEYKYKHKRLITGQINDADYYYTYSFN